MRHAGDGAGKNGPSHGEGQHGVDHKHDEQEEGYLETGKKKGKLVQLNHCRNLSFMLFFKIQNGMIQNED